MHQPNPGAPKKVELALRRRDALAFRLRGATYEQVADKLKDKYRAEGMEFSPRYGKQQARRDIMAALAETYADTKAEAATLIALNRERIAALLTVYWPKALSGDYNALEHVLGLMGKEEMLLGIHKGNGIAVEASVETNGEAGTTEARVSVWLPYNGRDDLVVPVALPDDVAAQIGQAQEVAPEQEGEPDHAAQEE